MRADDSTDCAYRNAALMAIVLLCYYWLYLVSLFTQITFYSD